MVRLQGLSKNFGATVAVDRVDLEIARGELFGLLGPSGSGKSTLLGLIAGFHEPDSGVVFIEDKDVTAVPAHRRNLAMMFQNYALFPHLNVFDNVGFGLKMKGVPRKIIQEKVKEALSIVRLEGYENRWPHQLSGGQQQRVGLARALVVDPKVLLLDEPLSALDKGLRDEMRMEIKEIQRKSGITTIFVTHDQNEALSLSDRVAIMDGGKIIQIDSPRQIHSRPKNSFVARFLGLQNVFSGKIVRREGGLVWVVPSGRGQPWVAQDRGLMEQGECTFYVRPERIRIVDQPREGSQNYLYGVVKETTYQGVYNEIRIELGEGVHLMVYDMTETQVVGLDPGTRVITHIDPKDVVII